ncbi:MAG: hypothetical protein U9N61_00070 [Euryarchaeota archaeon]|nr:hypothetical protein [Euryarchaeota archaeon]
MINVEGKEAGQAEADPNQGGNMGIFRYLLVGIGRGEKLWRCEVCGGDVQKMFFQIAMQRPSDSRRTHQNCQGSLIGHKECLLQMQERASRNESGR